MCPGWTLPFLVELRGFEPLTSAVQAAAVYNTFNVQRHLTSAQSHRVLRAEAISTWREVVAAA